MCYNTSLMSLHTIKKIVSLILFPNERFKMEEQTVPKMSPRADTKKDLINMQSCLVLDRTERMVAVLLVTGLRLQLLLTTSLWHQGPVSISHKTSYFKISQSPSRLICIKKGLIALQFDGHLDSSTTNLAASSLHVDLTIRRLIKYWNRTRTVSS